MGCSILILQGDAEARLLREAELTLQSCFPDSGVQVTGAWTTRSDLLRSTEQSPLARAAQTHLGTAELLAAPHDLVVLSVLADAVLPLLRGPGGAFVAHRGLLEHFSAEQRASLPTEYRDTGLIDVDASTQALEAVVEELQSRGASVALCNIFRHVSEPLEHRAERQGQSLRQRIREFNVAVANISRRTGCFVVDVNRALADEGGAALAADCFGGAGRAEELALEELVAVALAALPNIAEGPS